MIWTFLKMLFGGLEPVLFTVATLILILNGETGWAIAFFVLTVLTI